MDCETTGSFPAHLEKNTQYTDDFLHEADEARMDFAVFAFILKGCPFTDPVVWLTEEGEGFMIWVVPDAGPNPAVFLFFVDPDDWWLWSDSTLEQLIHYRQYIGPFTQYLIELLE